MHVNPQLMSCPYEGHYVAVRDMSVRYSVKQGYITPPLPYFILWNAVTSSVKTSPYNTPPPPHTSFCETQWRHSVKTRLYIYKNPPPYCIVLASSVKTKEVEVIEFHRILSVGGLLIKWSVVPHGATIRLCRIYVSDILPVLIVMLTGGYIWRNCSFIIKAWHFTCCKKTPLRMFSAIGPSKKWSVTSLAAILQNGRQNVYKCHYLSA